MSTMQEEQQNNFKLAQYFNLCRDGYAEQMFNKEFNINHQYSDTQSSQFIGLTALHLAANNVCKSDIKFLLSRGADPTLKNRNGLTPLHVNMQVYCNDPTESLWEVPKSFSELFLSAQVKSGNSKNPSDEYGLSHFHIACMMDCAEAVEFFLKNGVSIDKTISTSSPKYPNYTALHLAARFSALQAIKVLLKYGANTRLKDTEGMTFMCMVLQSRAKIIGPLSLVPKHPYASKVADDNLAAINFLLQDDSHPIDYNNLSHFHMACSSTEISIAEGLLPKIADINQALDMDSPNWPGFTPLHFAAYSSIDMVKMLVKNGANILAKNAKGVAPLHYCIDRYKIEDIHAVLSLDSNWTSILMSDRKTRLLSLIFAMKNVKQFNNFIESRPQLVNTVVPHDSPAIQGFTPLHIAVTFYEHSTIIYRKGKCKDDRAEHIIHRLMAKGASINAKDARGMTPLHLAYRYKHHRVVDGMLQKYRDKLVDVIDDENLSHLHIACRMNNVPAVEKILQTCVDVNVMFKGCLENRCVIGGWTPLQCVSDDKIIALLLDHGADPYYKDANGMTAIHHSDSDSDALISLPDLRDSVVTVTGLSHLHVAVRRGNVDAVKTLLDNGANVNQAILQAEVLTLDFESNVKNRAGATPLDLALFDCTMEIVEMLVRRGAKVLVEEPFEVDPEDSQNLRPLISTLNHDDDLFLRLENEIGLTMLHVVCSRRDVDLTKALLESGADVNARIHVRSRLWPGYTPLHVVMEDPDHEKSLDEIVRLLLDNGADVTATTWVEGETALYLAYQSIPENLASNRYSCMKMFLRAHRDFTFNPKKSNCLSYFHVACTIGDVETVGKFLQHAGADINERTDFLKRNDSRTTRDTAGATALHLAAASSEEAVDPMSQLQIIDLLLKNGADVDALDVHGNTALHMMAQWNYRCRDVMLRLIRYKANANLKNLSGQTPLGVMLTTSKNLTRENSMRKVNLDATVDDVKFFLELGCCFNVFNRETEKGLIARTLTFIPFDNLLYLVKRSMVDFPQLMQTDEVGRTMMHNVVSNANGFAVNKPILSDEQYLTLIKELGKFDLDVDVQDALGRTPLYLAVLFRNIEAISGLLTAGADVNVIDTNGKTAFSYILDTSVRCLEERRLTPRRYVQFDHLNVLSTFMTHTKKLLLCGLDVNQINQNLMSTVVENCNVDGMSVHKDFGIQIAELRGLNIPQSKLKLESFLSEIDAVVAYATVPKTDRDAVDAFFKYEINNLRMRYSQVASILLLQYRKAVKRVELKQPAQFALNTLSRVRLPDLCSEEILKLLSNSELISMIESVA